MTLQEITLLLRGDHAAVAAELFQTLPDPEVGAAAAEQNTVIEARLALAQGQPQRALTLLNDLADATEAGGRLRRALTVRLLQALAHAALGHEPAALAALSVAVQQAAPQNYRRPFLDEDPVLARLLPRVRALAPEFVEAVWTGFGEQGRAGAETASAPPLMVEPLSERERQIVRLLDEGLSNQAIAERLVITLGTTKWHLNHIYGKLGVKSRTQAVRRAHELRLL
jgi:LuxR family maltose regulon positive regulatory protein